MKPKSLQHGLAMGFSTIVLCVFLIITNFVGCIPEDDPPASSGCGTVMGCCPATGCGRNWLGNNTNRCYPTSNECLAAGNNRCTQCY
ncbi:MAG: hypothetical protein K2Q24_03225 [Chitinophagaceae bacterium]|nr:hypothetical protein [Chitinophagaceae bacterium]